ncbi:MAG: hypothetical protein HC789_01275 [Microcoleus sp. CSU_2_2]|nr:hypothetical protein [Microcoleus sp. SU_5_3]NJS09090.1 hypothetical protein [Microcoleus sp. CSU_2_2]
MQNFNFPIKNSNSCQENPIAIVSGNIIHILYPNGELKAATAEQIDRLQTKTSLDKCLVWGRVDDF